MSGDADTLSAGGDALAVIVADDPGAFSDINGRPALDRILAAVRSASLISAVRIAASDPAVITWAGSNGVATVPVAAGAAMRALARPEQLPSLAAAVLSSTGASGVVVVVDAAAALLTGDDLNALAAAAAEAGLALARARVPAGFAASAVGALDATTVAAVAAGAAALEPVRVSIPFDRLRRIETSADRSIAATLLIERARAGRLAALPQKPAALIMDFDGVFTDNRVIVPQDGIEAVRCNRSDGLRLEQMRARGLPLLVLSKERNPVVAARCAKLRLECLQAVDEKRPALERWCAERTIDLRDVVYIGNDSNDLPAFAAVGCAVAVADAWPEALAAADMVLSRPGGDGALRELSDLILERLECVV